MGDPRRLFDLFSTVVGLVGLGLCLTTIYVSWRLRRKRADVDYYGILGANACVDLMQTVAFLLTFGVGDVG